jgi:hypothetical protein
MQRKEATMTEDQCASAEPSASADSKPEVGKINDFKDVFAAYEKFFIKPMTEANPFVKWLSDGSAGNFDSKRMLDEHQVRLRALTRANEEAAAAFQKHIQRQSEIFETIMKSAQDSAAKVQVSGKPEATEANAKLFSSAIKTATQLMQQLSEETAAASEEAYRKIRSEIDTAMEKFRSE